MTTPLTSSFAQKLHGEIAVPGDKSISHRALILASQVIGTTRISGLLEGEDVLGTARALSALGVPIKKSNGEWQVNGVGIGGLHESKTPLDMGNSGTSARLLMGLLASYPFSTSFIGDVSLSKRPMGRVIQPLEQIGARFESQNGTLPITLKGTATPLPLAYRLPVPSAQVKSAVLLAGLNTPGTTTTIESAPTRDHTETILEFFGFNIERSKDGDGNRSASILGQYMPPRAEWEIKVPGDPSSAAFLVVAALLTPQSHLLIRNICINPLRAEYLNILRAMGGKIEMKNKRMMGGEAIADIEVHSSTLHAIEIPEHKAPMLIDEYPILAIAAAAAEGKSTMHGLKELRVKESDRLSAIVKGLYGCGVKTKSEGDTLYVMGKKEIPGGGSIKTNHDHRIAMAFLVLGMISKSPLTVDDGSMIATSFPNFVALMNSIGAHIA